MPTQVDMSPQRILPLILTIPLLLLFAVAGSPHVQGPVTLSYAAVPIQFERHDLPAGRDDEAIKDALPVPPADDDETRRKLRGARVILNCQPSTAPPFQRRGRDLMSFSTLDSLVGSLLSGRPPPPFPAQT